MLLCLVLSLPIPVDLQVMSPLTINCCVTFDDDMLRVASLVLQQCGKHVKIALLILLVQSPLLRRSYVPAFLCFQCHPAHSNVGPLRMRCLRVVIPCQRIAFTRHWRCKHVVGRGGGIVNEKRWNEKRWNSGTGEQNDKRVSRK